jgi:hypothetical protein
MRTRRLTRIMMIIYAFFTCNLTKWRKTGNFNKDLSCGKYAAPVEQPGDFQDYPNLDLKLR